MTKTPVYNEPICVRTPLALLTAPRDNEPVPGKPCANELTIFEAPIANNSWVASTDFPFAMERNNKKNTEKKISIRCRQNFMVEFLTKCFAHGYIFQ